MKIVTGYWNGELKQTGQYVQILDPVAKDGFVTIVLNVDGNIFTKPVLVNSIHHVKHHELKVKPEYLTE